VTGWFVYWRYDRMYDRWNMYGFPRSHDDEPPLLAWMSAEHDCPEARWEMCQRLGRTHGVRVIDLDR
jgi:hypothetical protein